MELPKTYINNNRGVHSGFTLFEVLIVMSMLAIMAGVTVFISVSSVTREVLNTEQSLLISLLQTARAESMQNKNQLPHGLVIDPPGYVGYVAFEGNSYIISASETRIWIPRSPTIKFSSSSRPEIVFTQLSGEVDVPGLITLIDSNSSASTSVTVNHEGAIY